MAKQLMPSAALLPRASDVQLNEEQMLKLSLFAKLTKKPSLEKYPGALMLRRYKKGEVIFTQGDPGWTAFYILTNEDILSIGQQPMQTIADVSFDDWASIAEVSISEFELNEAQERDRMLREAVRNKDAEAERKLRDVATVYLANLKHGVSVSRKPGLLGGQVRPATPLRNQMNQTVFIPKGGLGSAEDYEMQKATLYEGELFGEASCMYRTPRSATIRATRDCYMLEMLRNILDQLRKNDKAYKAKMDEIFKQRILQLHLRKLSIFRDLNDKQFATIKDKVELITVEPGACICDENERPESMFIVRGGLVKVLRNSTSLVGRDNLGRLAALATKIRQGAEQTKTPLAKLWSYFKPEIQAILKDETRKSYTHEEQNEIQYAINDILKNPKFGQEAEFKEVLLQPGFREQVADLPAKQKEWNDQHVRRFNRVVLNTILGDVLEASSGRVEYILSYLSQGEVVGEGGLVTGEPRGATCIAHSHPNHQGEVELVKISKEAFDKMADSYPIIKDRIKEEVKKRREMAAQVVQKPIWDEGANQVQLSTGFEKLGLIQGQKLMLIDLDRCTRCDECVKACVNAHDDGRSRLFLDGPRFGKYLVPMTCRSCLDPVCMIGCPVASIHRGDNRQIVIENWCIGCALCAEQCPYGSIQMHDVGVIPVGSHQWRYMPASAVKSDSWFQPQFKDTGWLGGATPFHNDRDMNESLADVHASINRAKPFLSNQPVLFRHPFTLKEVNAGTQFRMEIVATSDELSVWINGQEIKPDSEKKGKREYNLPKRAVLDAPSADADMPMGEKDNSPWQTLRGAKTMSATAKPKASKPPKLVIPPAMFVKGVNVLAVRVVPKGGSTDVLFDARLDEVKKPQIPTEVDAEVAEEITEKQVTQKAVVCDLCSPFPGQIPACVHACPHEAAMRVDARSEFPVH